LADWASLINWSLSGSLSNIIKKSFYKKVCVTDTDLSTFVVG